MKINGRLVCIYAWVACATVLFSSCWNKDNKLAKALNGTWQTELESEDEDGMPIRQQLVMRFKYVENSLTDGGTFTETNHFTQYVEEDGIAVNYMMSNRIFGVWEVVLGDLYLEYDLSTLEVSIDNVDIRMEGFDYEMQALVDGYEDKIKKELYTESYQNLYAEYEFENETESFLENLEVTSQTLSFISNDAGLVTFTKKITTK